MTLPMDPKLVVGAIREMDANWSEARELLAKWERHGSSKWGLGVAMDVARLTRQLHRLESPASDSTAERLAKVAKRIFDIADDMIEGRPTMSTLQCLDAIQQKHQEIRMELAEVRDLLVQLRKMID
jgi:hypothetical protein